MQDEFSFGRWLQQRRLQLDLNQQAPGKQVGLSANMSHRIEADPRRPSSWAALQPARGLTSPESELQAFLRCARGEAASIQPAPIAGPLTPVPATPQVLPRGTVTFLFTDIEGSTVLREHCPDLKRQALLQHDGLIERLVVACEGQLVCPRGEGDNHFAVFPRATDAVMAAVCSRHTSLRHGQPLHYEDVWRCTRARLTARAAITTG